MNGWYKALEQLVWVTQLGFSIIFPLICCLAGCWWLTVRMGAPGWVWPVGVLVGLGVGIATFWSFAKMWMRQIDREGRKQRPPGFNEHR